ncbi:MAG: hypothetical protein JJT87_01655 [Halomonas sp.]|nr:hypothetical protein [Halomonas sp.]MCC5900618.1 hypothetical protein [Halomonas sp.]
MSTQIIFTVDLDSLSSVEGGSFDQPSAVGHPNMLVSKDKATSTSHEGDYPVPVQMEEQVQVWLEDVSRRPSVLIAPVRFMAHTWKGDDGVVKTFVTGTPPDPTKQINVFGNDTPLTLPSFMERHPEEYGFDYDTTPSPQWSDDSKPFLEYWKDGGVMAGKDGDLKSPLIHTPYVTLAIGDSVGLLNYGIEFVVYVNGKSKGYFWFDPYINVLS